MAKKLRPIDMTKIIEKNRGKWVAILDTGKSAKVVASGKTREQVEKKCEDLDIEKIIITHIPSQMFSYIL